MLALYGFSKQYTKKAKVAQVSKGICLSFIDPKREGVDFLNREMHTHQQSEWGFLLVGSCRVTAVDELGRHFVADIDPGEGRIFPKNNPHSMQGLHEGFEFLMFF